MVYTYGMNKSSNTEEALRPSNNTEAAAEGAGGGLLSTTAYGLVCDDPWCSLYNMSHVHNPGSVSTPW